MDQIGRAVQQFHADTLGITFSGAYPYKNIRPHLRELRELIPGAVDIWTGGEGSGIRSPFFLFLRHRSKCSVTTSSVNEGVFFFFIMPPVVVLHRLHLTQTFVKRSRTLAGTTR